MKITIIYSVDKKKQAEVEFSSEKDAFLFIHYNQPITIFAIRIENES